MLVVSLDGCSAAFGFILVQVHLRFSLYMVPLRGPTQDNEVSMTEPDNATGTRPQTTQNSRKTGKQHSTNQLSSWNISGVQRYLFFLSCSPCIRAKATTMLLGGWLFSFIFVKCFCNSATRLKIHVFFKRFFERVQGWLLRQSQFWKQKHVVSSLSFLC